MNVNRDHQIREALGAVIRDARAARGLTLKQLAALADIDWSQLSKVERGDSGVSPATLERIGQELGFSLPALYSAALAKAGAAKRKPGSRGRRAVQRSSAARLVRGVAGVLPSESPNRS